MQDDLEEKSSSLKRNAGGSSKQMSSESFKQTANKRLSASRKSQSKEMMSDESLNRRKSKDVVGQERTPSRKLSEKIKSKELLEQEDGERSRSSGIVSNKLKAKSKERKSSATFTSSLHKQLSNKNKLSKSSDSIITPSEDREDEKQSEQVKSVEDVTPSSSGTINTVKSSKLVRLQNDVEYKDDSDEIIFEDDMVRKESVPVNLHRFIGVKNSLFLKMPLNSDFSLSECPENESKDDVRGSIRALGKLVALANKISVIPASTDEPVNTSITKRSAVDSSNSDELRSENYIERNEPATDSSGYVDKIQKVACIPAVDASGKTESICKIDRAGLADKPDSYVCCQCPEEGLASPGNGKETCSKHPEKTCVCRQALKIVESSSGPKKRSSLLKTSDRRSYIPKRTSFCVECQTPPPPSVENQEEELQKQEEEEVLPEQQEEQLLQKQQEEQVLQTQQEVIVPSVEHNRSLPYVDSEKAVLDLDTDDSYLNTISERTEITSDISSLDPATAEEKLKQLTVQHLPQISIKPPLVVQKVFEIEIKPTGSVNMQVPAVQNIRYEEILHAESFVDDGDIRSRPSDTELETEVPHIKEVKIGSQIKTVKSNVSFKDLPFEQDDSINKLKTRSFNERPPAGNLASTTNNDVSNLRMSSNVLLFNKDQDGNVVTATERRLDVSEDENNDDDFDDIPSEKEAEEVSDSVSFAQQISNSSTAFKDSLINFLPKFILSEVMKREEQILNENMTQEELTKLDTDPNLVEENEDRTVIQSDASRENRSEENQLQENQPEESQPEEDKLEEKRSEENQPEETQLEEDLIAEDVLEEVLIEGETLGEDKDETIGEEEEEDINMENNEETDEEEVAEIETQEKEDIDIEAQEKEDIDIEAQEKEDFVEFEIQEEEYSNNEILAKEQDDDQDSKLSALNSSPGGTPLFIEDFHYHSRNNMPMSISTYFRESNDRSCSFDGSANQSDMVTEILSKLSEAGGLKDKVNDDTDEDEDGSTLNLVHVLKREAPNTDEMVKDALNELDKDLKNLEYETSENVTIVNCDCICKKVQEQPKQKRASRSSISTGSRSSNSSSASTAAKPNYSPPASTAAKPNYSPPASTDGKPSYSSSLWTAAKPCYSLSARPSNPPSAKPSRSPSVKPSYSPTASTSSKPTYSTPKAPLKSAQKVPSKAIKKRSTKSSENFTRNSDNKPNNTVQRNVPKNISASKRISIVTDKKCSLCSTTKPSQVIENVPPVNECKNSSQPIVTKGYVVRRAPSIIKKLSLSNPDKEGYSDPNVKSSLMSAPRPLDLSKCIPDEYKSKSASNSKRTTSFHSTTKSPYVSDSDESVYVLTHDVSVQVSDESILSGKKVSTTISKSDKKLMRVGMSDEIDSKMKKKQKVNSKDQKQQISSCAENKCCTCDVPQNLILQPVTVHYETKGVQKSLEDWAYKPVKLHKMTNCKDLDTSSLNETDLENLPCRNAPCGDISTCPEFVSTYQHREDTTSSSQCSNKKNVKYHTASSSSSDVIGAKVEESLSEGEIKCKCSVSIGELHLCRLANNIKARTAYLKRHPDKLIKQEFPGENVHLFRQQTFYDNWVAYYASRGSGTSESESNEILTDS